MALHPLEVRRNDITTSLGPTMMTSAAPQSIIVGPWDVVISLRLTSRGCNAPMYIVHICKMFNLHISMYNCILIHTRRKRRELLFR